MEGKIMIYLYICVDRQKETIRIKKYEYTICVS